MPGTYTYPGVYVEEIPSGVRTISGVSTSDTAFVGFFKRGPKDKAKRITSFAEFERVYGGLDSRSEAAYAIQQFYLNGGDIAWVVRVADGTPLPSETTLKGGSPPQDTVTIKAANPGEWGDGLQVAVDYKTKESDQFNLVVREVVTSNGRKQVVNTEIHRNLSMKKSDPRYAVEAIKESSDLVRLEDAGLGELPATTGSDVTDASIVGDPEDKANAFKPLGSGADGSVPDSDALVDGMKELEKIAPYVFNILCLPAAANLNPTGLSKVVSEATTFCEDKRAFLIVDIPASVNSSDDMVTWMGSKDTLRHRNAAIYYPRLEIPDALNEDRPRNVGVSGTLAGVYARTDSTRGVWKAPAGTEAALRGAAIPEKEKLTDKQTGGLNQIGINVLRTFPIYGNVSWGARTMDGADQAASEWKYIPVRRTALFIEESLYQGLKWVVFEPNDEPLWAQIRLNVGAFMQNLFRQGAFQGTTPREAYFVKCDKETTTQNDIDKGIVNIVVGFAPLKPAEFVVIKIQQIAGQIQT
jgi:phage tail sheath protein FI